MSRIVSVHTNSDQELLFKHLHGSEGLSTLFNFELDLLSSNSNLQPAEILGQSMTLAIQVDAWQVRYLNGEVVGFSYVGQETGGRRLTLYRAYLRPWLWYLGRNQDCRIYQNMNVVDILDEVLGSYPGYHYEKRLSAEYTAYDYCVQYEESDLNFIHRLMEQEGIYYYFEHSEQGHTLILCDDPSSHFVLPWQASIPYFPSDDNVLSDVPSITQWRHDTQLSDVEYVLDDYDFKKSAASLRHQRRVPTTIQQANREVFDWQAGYIQADHGEHYARVRMEGAQSVAQRIEGVANTRALAPGYTFTLSDSPRTADLQDYLLLEVRYFLNESGYFSGDGVGSYRLEFVAQPAALPFRPPMLTPRPKTKGPQTAVVTGPSGQEVYTDEYQRIKLLFRWDRYGRADENSSCWIRVSNDSAGAGFGSVMAPRIGQEVIVDFIGGNPDRPIVTGRVYNDRQAPAFQPSPTQSGFISRSFGGGSAANANFLLFDDAQGAESVHLHAERNLLQSVEVDAHVEIDGNHYLTVGEEQKIQVGQDRGLEVGGNSTIDIQGNEQITVEGNLELKVNGTLDETIKQKVTQTYLDQHKLDVHADAEHTYLTTLQERFKGEYTSTKEDLANYEYQNNLKITVDGVTTVHYKDDYNVTYGGNEIVNYVGKRTENYQSLWEEFSKYTIKKSIGRSNFFGLVTNVVGAQVNTMGFVGQMIGAEGKYVRHKLDYAKSNYELNWSKKKIVLKEDKVKALGKDLSALQSEVSGIKNEKEGLKKEMSGINKKVGALESRTNVLIIFS
ncbi:type VI secretion system Vgr family protein [Alcaligenes endophyticus]|uniref:Type VI secretion system tip protein VgrG n=1 Tax=Alcaligenes endophyticus TaxID=1929088 RepID=A0ABT8EKQ5_9BURK|nr:type VI secretion system tip protein TssI/VgrG [Alcaligenes endophyticus]MCX5590754.1 type VI secretion system tip protein TssI/VgrG [Alcaligenes endophyticus]MDN4121883.1 type VI secretion system tip protein VgrG [Alcaligenes endophyticus]